MLGFIKKDLLVIRSNMKFLLVIFVLYILMALDGDMSLAFLPTFLSIFLMMGGFSYDNYNNWDTYSISFPNGRKNSVKSKYITTILMTSIISIITIILSFIIAYKNNQTNYEQILITNLLEVAATLLVLTFMYPIIYKFGIEKARIGIFIIVFGLVIIGSFIAQYLDLSFIAKLLSFLENYLVIILIIITILMVYISYKISEKIFMKKEF